MRIAVYVPAHIKDHFIVQTLLYLAKDQPRHTFIFITDKKDLFSDLSSNFEVIISRPAPKNKVIQKLWWSRQLQNTIRKIKADILISLNDSNSFPLSIPQILVVTDINNIKIGSLKQFYSLIVTNKKAKELLTQQNLFPPDRISIVYPYSDKIFRPVNNDSKDITKKQYSDGSEFFLYNGSLKQEDLIYLLKAFSHFKKRQQSGFKLLLILESNPVFKNSLESYKYRNDVKFIYSINKEEQARITASAYAVVLPFNNKEGITSALSSMQAGVPLINTNNSFIKEIVNESAAFIDSASAKDLGEQMIKLYTNENLREELIDKGKKAAREFTLERSARSLWKAITTP